MIIKNVYFNHRMSVIAGFVAPQLLFILTYTLVDPLMACGLMAVTALISAFCMLTRVVCGYVTHILAKFIMAVCAATAYIQSEPSYFMAWVTIYAVLAGMLTLSANAARRMSIARDTNGYVVMSDKGSRMFQVMHFLSLLGLAVIAEWARRSMSMDSWVWFQLIVPSLYYWATMLWTILLIKSHIVVNGERIDHYIVRFLNTDREK